MSSSRPPIRVPGFAPEDRRRPALADVTPVVDANGPEHLDRRAGIRQLNVRVLVPLHRHYLGLLRDVEDEGFDTSMAEVVQALLFSGPRTGTELKALVRAWRQALDRDA